MTYKELIETYKSIYQLVGKRQISEAFSLLSRLADFCKNVDYRNRLNANQETYRNILKYSFEQGDDPEKKKVFERLVKSVLELTDDMKEEIILQNDLLSYYKLKERQVEETDQKIDDVENWVNRIILLNESGADSMEGEDSNQTSAKTFERPGEGGLKFFRYFWLNDKLLDHDISLIKKIIENRSFPWYYKSLLVSGLTLSLIRHFDNQKIIALFDIYSQQEEQVWQRAVVGILIALYLNDQRINLYPEITDRIKLLQGDRQWNKTVESIVIQFLRAKDTEKVTEKIKKEIIPEIWKIRSTLEDKLNMEDLLKDKMLEDKNPEWERVFEDTPDLYNKMEEFSNLQMEGSDVFLSAFAMLKRFDFFNYISNWFLPFYKENEYFSDTFKDVKEDFDSDTFLEGLERTGFLCNSDKYSFCLNVKHMPSMQKSMMVELFNMELQAMNEMSSEDELLRKNVKNRSVIVQYIQDLYRFFRLHPMHKEFHDIFELKLDFHNKTMFNQLVDEKDIVRNIGEFYFEKDHYEEALEIFKSLETHEKGYELLEKIAYSYQCLGDFKNALDYYKKAEIVSKPRTWLLNKIAFCYRRLEKYDDAISYYKSSEELDPENLYVQTSMGQVYMDKKEFEEALKYFFKVEYLAPDNIKVHRPIAWCSFVLGKHENARKYFEKIVSKEGNKYDYMNLGHVFWSKGDKNKAIDNYRLSLKKSELDYRWFMETMLEDAQYLIKYNIPEFDIHLMIDYIRITSSRD